MSRPMIMCSPKIDSLGVTDSFLYVVFMGLMILLLLSQSEGNPKNFHGAGHDLE